MIFNCMYHRIIMEAADINERICNCTRKLQFLFINNVRTRPIINLNKLDFIKFIEKCCVVVVIEYVCGCNYYSSTHKTLAVQCSQVSQG